MSDNINNQNTNEYLKNMNAQKRNSKSYKETTTVRMKKSTRALLNDLADENRVKSVEMSDIIIKDYAKREFPEIYDLFIKEKLKGQMNYKN